ncbi:MAG: GNAT family N-acetyltransferase [Treponema sp.]|jgi:GNAT superfamily N-acetyltransferase|nr:GNAT family N-acetyltransferase [Treponema sp.]
MQINIRPPAVQDIPYLYEICLKTGKAGEDASALFKDPYMLGQYYAAPYAFYPDSICFIAAEDGIPQGYIVCAPDTEDYGKWLEKSWLPLLRERYPQPYPAEKIASETESRMALVFHKQHPVPQPAWYALYPAHLHIDLLKTIQGKGWGRRLMESLWSALSERKVPGLHLGVNRTNTGALAFYKKMGFSSLAEDEGGFTLGKALS